MTEIRPLSTSAAVAREERWSALDALAEARGPSGDQLLSEVRREILRQLPAGESWSVELAWRLGSRAGDGQWKAHICTNDETRHWTATGYGPSDLFHEIRARVWPEAKALLWRGEDEAAELRAEREREVRCA
jgi:hypothetical protein